MAVVLGHRGPRRPGTLSASFRVTSHGRNGQRENIAQRDERMRASSCDDAFFRLVASYPSAGNTGVTGERGARRSLRHDDHEEEKGRKKGDLEWW
jgi:hypothetical protein